MPEKKAQAKPKKVKAQPKAKEGTVKENVPQHSVAPEKVSAPPVVVDFPTTMSFVFVRPFS